MAVRLRLILGQAGTGKSSLCYKEIVGKLGEGCSPLYLITPAHLVTTAEREILSRCGGFEGLRIITLHQLAIEVLRRQGSFPRLLGHLHRQILFQSILHEHKDKLTLLGQAASRYRFAQTIAQTIDELGANGIPPREFADLASSLPELGGQLFQDLAVVARQYNTELSEYEDRNSVLFKATAALKCTEDDASTPDELAQLREGFVWLDGFALLSPLETMFIEALAAAVKQVTITWTLTGREKDIGPKTVLSTLEENLRLKGAQVEHICCTGGHARPGSLNGLVSHYPTTDPVDHGNDNTIHLICCENELQELEWTAAQISSLVRDKGIRWQDVAVIVGDLSRYRRPLADTFDRYRIPHSIPAQTRGVFHPLPRLFVHVLDVFDSKLESRAVLELIKSPLWPGTWEEKAELELFVKANGIDKELWLAKEPWPQRAQILVDEDSRALTPQNPGELERIQALRDKLLTPLVRIYETLWPHSENDGDNNACSAAKVLTALWELLTDMDLETISECDGGTAWSQFPGRLSGPQGLQSVWDQLVEIFNLLHQRLGSRVIPWHQFSNLFRGALHEIRLPQPDPEVDEVRVLTADQALGTRVKYGFIIGCIDGAFDTSCAPGTLVSASHLTIMMRHLQVRYPSLPRQRDRGRELIQYAALACATDGLYISWPRSIGGRDAYPHSAVITLEQMFPQLKPADCRGPLPVEKLTNLEAAAMSIEDAAAQSADALLKRLDVYEWMRQTPEGLKALRRQVIQMAEQLDSRLAPQTARQLYGMPLFTSVSQLEQFARCPFAHFLRYGLRVQDPPEYSLQSLDFGILIHAGLREFLTKLQQLEWKLPESGVEAIVDDILRGLSQRTKDNILGSNARHRHLYNRLHSRLSDAVTILLTEMKRSKFRPLALELVFGPNTPLKDVTLELPNGQTAILRGRIDRVDVAEAADGTKLVRVWDYKSGKTDLDLSDVADGLALQLLAYCMILVENGLNGWSCKPAAVQYFRVGDAFLSSPSGPLPEEKKDYEWEKQYAVSGLFAEEPDVLKKLDELITIRPLYPVRLKNDGTVYKTDQNKVLAEHQWPQVFSYVKDRMSRLAEDILEGNVELYPYRRGQKKACTWCQYKHVCRFDPAVVGHRFRELPPVPWQSKKQRLLEAIQQSEVVEKLRCEERGGEGV